MPDLTKSERIKLIIDFLEKSGAVGVRSTRWPDPRAESHTGLA